MIPIPGYPTPPPPGLNETVEATGISLVNVSGVWSAGSPAQALQAAAIAASYNPLPWVIALRKAEAAALKETVETGGTTTAGGLALDTAVENQTRLLRLSCSTEATPLPSNFWVKDRAGVFTNLSRAAARDLGAAINTFFQACVSGEANAVAAINAPAQTWQQVMAINLRPFFPLNS